MPPFLTYFVPTLSLVAFGGLAYVALTAVRAGTEAYSDQYSTDTARQFEDLFLFIPPERISQLAWVGSVAFFFLGFALVGDFSSSGGMIRGVVMGVVAGGIALLVPRWLLVFLRHQRLRRFNAQLVDGLTSMSNALKAGFSITQAVEAVVKEGKNPLAQEFSVFLQQIRVGVRFEDGLANLEQRVGSDDLTLVVRAIEVARLTGGNLTEVFGKIAETIRERLRIEGRIRSLTAQGRLQGIVVGLMPALLGLALFFMDPRMMMSFFNSTIGFIILGAVVILEIAGALMIRKIIKIDV